MREKAEYMASNVAAYIVLETTMPPARNVTYDTPCTAGIIAPRP